MSWYETVGVRNFQGAKLSNYKTFGVQNFLGTKLSWYDTVGVRKYNYHCEKVNFHGKKVLSSPDSVAPKKMTLLSHHMLVLHKVLAVPKCGVFYLPQQLLI